ncbi:DUF3800 domain-containing protein [Mesomycoplasma neurolyticum]|uniref:DUF3800 domain-containing protein n=1 Tax=Mesomycoplasma neurolyticum TaxID=2120 RepID=A0A449A522_9BACT|nr:DUF3800 domain-containing protein [Mesomycoplasma neurolyticum]VEU59329.1 Uncharacterised protein [Mesomycoplasma neurolyticum]
MNKNKQNENTKIQEITFFIDDSGTINKKTKDEFFVYAGYVFLNKKDINDANNLHKSIEKEIKNKIGENSDNREIKGSNTSYKDRKRLIKSLSKYYKIGIISKFKEWNSIDLKDKSSIGRNKDFLIKILIKETLKELEIIKKISFDIKTIINIKIDNQTTKSNGYYSLEKLISAELNGTINPLFNTKIFNKEDLKINLSYANSKKNSLIRSADLVANNLNSIFHNKKRQIKNIKYFLLILPTIQNKKFKLKKIKNNF